MTFADNEGSILERFYKAICEGELGAAQDELSRLAEFKSDLTAEITELGDLEVAMQTAEDTCERHGVYLCSLCFNTDPIVDGWRDLCNQMQPVAMNFAAFATDLEAIHDLPETDVSANDSPPDGVEDPTP